MKIPTLKDYVNCMTENKGVEFESNKYIVESVKQLPYDNLPGHRVQQITLMLPEGNTQHILKITMDVCHMTSTHHGECIRGE